MVFANATMDMALKWDEWKNTLEMNGRTHTNSQHQKIWIKTCYFMAI